MAYIPHHPYPHHQVSPQKKKTEEEFLFTAPPREIRDILKIKLEKKIFLTIFFCKFFIIYFPL